ncbi:MAG: hypothetical protein IPM57_08765 [Oligoflexia bacterium]|nr:hypothetical protein [Oligoflexia bacterium]
MIRLKIQEIKNNLVNKSDESWRSERTKSGMLRKVPPRIRRQKWEPKKVEHVYHIVPQEVQEQLITSDDGRLSNFFK